MPRRFSDIYKVHGHRNPEIGIVKGKKNKPQKNEVKIHGESLRGRLNRSALTRKSNHAVDVTKKKKKKQPLVNENKMTPSEGIGRGKAAKTRNSRREAVKGMC